MSAAARTNQPPVIKSVHGIGVVCGLAAGVWLGAAEAPTKLVNSGLSPYAISLCMVAGVFTARWTVPTLLKGTRQVFADLARTTPPDSHRHSGRHAVGSGQHAHRLRHSRRGPGHRLSALEHKLPRRHPLGPAALRRIERRKPQEHRQGRSRRAGHRCRSRHARLQHHSHERRACRPRASAASLPRIGASLLWGTMYIPYRKAYISGMNPLSFVTVFTIGELGTMFALVLALDGGTKAAVFHSGETRHLLFWLFLGGFVWVIGDLFQQFATKYLGIGRGIPLSNTNQMWGLAWGALVFGELAHADAAHRLLVVVGSLVMICGALAVTTAVATEKEHASMREALVRECARYDLDYDRVVRSAMPAKAPATAAERPRVVGLCNSRRCGRRLHLARHQRPRARTRHELRLGGSGVLAVRRFCMGSSAACRGCVAALDDTRNSHSSFCGCLRSAQIFPPVTIRVWRSPVRSIS